MELKRLAIRNFLGIGEGEVTFDKPGVVLVEGLNHDSPSSISNGAGKSSIFEALFWVLFSKTKRGLGSDEVINNVTRKNCRVMLEFDNYRIIRTRKDDELGTVLLFQQHQPDEEWKDLTLGSTRDTQKLIEDTIKMSELTFSKVAYFGQGDVKGFAELTDADLKKVFEQALGLTFFAEYLEKVKDHRITLAMELRETENLRDRALRDRAHTIEKMDILQRSIEEHEKRRAEERLKLEADRAELDRERERIENNADSALSEIGKELATLAVKATEKNSLEASHHQIHNRWLELNRLLAGKQTQNSILAGEVESLKAEIITVEAKPGTPCETCGKVYETTDLEIARQNLMRRLEERILAHDTGLCEEQLIKARMEEILREIELLREKLSDYDQVAPRTVHLKTRRDEWIRTRGERLSAIMKRTKEIESLLDELERKEPRVRAEFEKAKNELARIEDAITMFTGRIGNLETEVETARLLEEILGNGGMKSYVFDAITPQLNKLIDRNIKKLDDIDVEVTTVTKLKSGEYREKFFIKVHNHHGANVFQGNSGGEMQKINLAISLAINRLVRTIAEGSINTIFLDECFENLDEGSSERVLELIDSIDTPNVFLITQRQGIKELVPYSISVEKRGGRAVIH
jgi:DNA repair exonuclease SbcCD ATPase subunit